MKIMEQGKEDERDEVKQVKGSESEFRIGQTLYVKPQRRTMKEKKYPAGIDYHRI
jgi:hypothetical protein